ncbi:MAG TPA: helix-turn-helix transcriptional regulator [Candidatus Gallibacteroides avistercoris]|uniref:Helix-turn-helix transcriptional regulator n=1 Tax=Candidatus Gallibacteroides avistercoris TaxID=2840833 RepID=A0A9D1M932_9BACT|nr:helix-turn-helix transcriptional regulator [Candidatus Gallibacteroides avistercoris]
MNEQIKQIAQRLIGLRDVLDITTAQMAEVCGVSEAEYIALESGTVDISVSLLYRIAKRYNIELSTLMFGDEPRMNAYFLTRKDKGAAVERVKAYKYQSLAAGFMNRLADPFLVTVDPKPENTEIHLNTHPGQEFNMMIEGRMMLSINGKELILETGDSIYFDSSLPHGMKALDGKTVKFLAMIIAPQK